MCPLNVAIWDLNDRYTFPGQPLLNWESARGRRLQRHNHRHRLLTMTLESYIRIDASVNWNALSINKLITRPRQMLDFFFCYTCFSVSSAIVTTCAANSMLVGGVIIMWHNECDVTALHMANNNNNDDNNINNAWRRRLLRLCLRGTRIAVIGFL